MSSRSRDLIASVLVNKGICPAEIYCVAQGGTAPHAYWKDWFDADKWGVLPSTVFGLMTAGRNDTMIVMPGAYAETAELAWNKAHTHMVGFAGPNNFNLHTDEGANIYTSTAQVVETIDCTGDKCQFHDVLIANVGNHAENVAAFNLDAGGCIFKGVMFMGAKNPLNAVAETASSLHIDGGGDNPLFEDCVIGDNNGSVRATAEHTAALRFTGTDYAMNGEFRRCRFNIKNDTNDNYHHCVYIASKGVNKQWVFNDCHFYHYSTNNAYTQGFVFWDGCMTTHSILLNNCSMQGFNEWQHGDLGDAFFGVSMPIASVAGGIVLNPTSA